MNPIRSVQYRTRRYARLLHRQLEGRRDHARVAQRWPALANYEELARSARESLRRPYQDYVASYSLPEMAISLELATLMLVLCRVLRPQRVADLGSGFSSYVARSYALESGAEVWSVDHEREWLGVSAGFLAKHGLDASRLFEWTDFLAQRPAPFDFMLHDIGHADSFRGDVLGRVLDLCAPTGVVLLDDVHKAFYDRQARAELARRRWEQYSLRSYTLDRIGRYAMMVTPPAGIARSDTSGTQRGA